jgi:hypothetical protein
VTDAVPELTQEQVSRASRSRLLVLAMSKPTVHHLEAGHRPVNGLTEADDKTDNARMREQRKQSASYMVTRLPVRRNAAAAVALARAHHGASAST